MSTALVKAFSIADTKLWKGGCRIVLGLATGTGVFPTNFEDVIDPTTMALVAPYTDFGATNEDGFTVSRTWDEIDGVATDQRDFLLREGSVENVAMTGTAVSLYTDITTMAYLWGLGTVSTVAAVVGPPAKRGFKKANLGTVTDITPRIFCILQQNNVSGKLRMFAFRKARVTSPGDLTLQSRVTASNEFNLTFDPDPAIIDGSDFGLLFEET